MRKSHAATLEVKRAYREAHREERRAYQRAYRAAHLDELRAYGRAYARAYREAHPEKRRGYQPADRAAHLAKRRAYHAATQPYLSLAGTRVTVGTLPEELQPVARLIQETRREIRNRRNAA